MTINFTDKACFDQGSKSAISVRDGYQEYLGMELGLEPPNKMFKVYRSPETIFAAKDKMINTPVTDEHIELSELIPPALIKGQVLEAEVIKVPMDINDAAICVKNKLALSDDVLELIANGKRELSLGYRADLIEHNGDYDFEQVNIEPHHLAMVNNGRCGAACSFTDKQEGNLMSHEVFLDEAGDTNLMRVVEIAQALPEAMRSMPIEELQKLLPALEEALAMAKVNNEATTEEAPAVDAEAEDEAVEEVATEDMEHEEGEEGESFTDSKQFLDAVSAMVDQKVAIIEKARNFVAEGYTFGDKSTDQIMRDALAVETDQSFEDAELSTAFKLLKKSTDYANFADGAANPFDELKDKEL